MQRTVASPTNDYLIYESGVARASSLSVDAGVLMTLPFHPPSRQSSPPGSCGEPRSHQRRPSAVAEQRGKHAAPLDRPRRTVVVGWCSYPVSRKRRAQAITDSRIICEMDAHPGIGSLAYHPAEIDAVIPGRSFFGLIDCFRHTGRNRLGLGWWRRRNS
jgi:hypothetical protein